eukprot:259006_1
MDSDSENRSEAKIIEPKSKSANPAASAWGTSADSAANGKNKAPQTNAEVGPEPAQFGRRRGRRADQKAEESQWVDDVVTEIAEIPDAGDGGTDTVTDIRSQVADAPNVLEKTVQSLSELDKEILVAPKGEDGIDLSLLTRFLSPPGSLAEPDTPWDFDQLLSQVASEMVSERIEREKQRGLSKSA